MLIEAEIFNSPINISKLILILLLTLLRLAKIRRYFSNKPTNFNAFKHGTRI